MSRYNSLTTRALHRFLQVCSPLISDRFFLNALFLLRTGRLVHWQAPRDFNEKLQVLKLWSRGKNLGAYVDKGEAGKIAGRIIGDKYILPLLGIWENVDDIDLDTLPDRFILKPSHGGGSGGILVCRDKREFRFEEGKRILKRSMATDIFRRFREYPYKSVKPRIIAQPLLDDKNGLKDYKFFCFNGKARFLKVDSNRDVRHRANYLTLDWQPLDIREEEFPPLQFEELTPPANFKLMIKLAEQLSAGFPFVRIDMYNVEGKIYFGEFTFFPASGLGMILPEERNVEIGKMLCLPSLTQN